MVMKSLRDGASGGLMKFVLIGFMALAVGGLVFTDMGGFFRGGVSGSDIAKVNGETISIQTFDRELSPFLEQSNMTRYEAFQSGLIGQALEQHINRKLVEQAAESLGLAINDDRASQKIKADLENQAIMAQVSEKELLDRILRIQNITADQFVETYRTQEAITTLQSTLQNATNISSSSLNRTLHTFDEEKRNISYVVLADKDAQAENEPTEEEIYSLYEQQKEQYTIPETRTIRVLTVTYTPPADSAISDDEALEELYALADLMDDMAASGAPLNDIAKESGGDIKTYENITPSSDTVDRTLLQVAYAIGEGEMSTVIEDEEKENTLHLINIASITPKAYKSFDDVRSDISKQASSNNQAMANKLGTLDKISRIKKGEKKLSDYGRVKSLKSVQRNKDIQKPFDASAIGRIFSSAVDDPVAVPVDEGMAIVIVTSLDVPTQAPNEEQTQILNNNLGRMNTNEMFALFIADLQKDAKISINDRLIQSAYGAETPQFQ